MFRVEELATHLVLQGKEIFLPRLLAYWTLKRKSRAGVPLLRRLQVIVLSTFYKFKVYYQQRTLAREVTKMTGSSQSNVQVGNV
jgi:hypothetical protein